jgi:hypothetical protein
MSKTPIPTIEDYFDRMASSDADGCAEWQALYTETDQRIVMARNKHDLARIDALLSDEELMDAMENRKQDEAVLMKVNRQTPREANGLI